MTVSRGASQITLLGFRKFEYRKINMACMEQPNLLPAPATWSGLSEMHFGSSGACMILWTQDASSERCRPVGKHAAIMSLVPCPKPYSAGLSPSQKFQWMVHMEAGTTLRFEAKTTASIVLSAFVKGLHEYESRMACIRRHTGPGIRNSFRPLAKKTQDVHCGTRSAGDGEGFRFANYW